MNPNPTDLLWVIVCAILVLLMQAGFLCLEAGSTRSKHNINVVVKNIADLGISVVCFWLFGYAFMFGRGNGWLGLTEFAPQVGQGEPWPVVFFLFQLMFCSTAVTIVSGAVAERMRFNSYVMVALMVSGLVYPIYGHWAWNGLNGGSALGWLGQIGFIDFAGSTVVHSIGGWVALAAVLIIGPRTGRFSAKRRRAPIYGYDLPIAMLGALLLWVGWLGFNGGSALAFDNQVPGILSNTVLAGAAGLVIPILFYLPQGRQVPVAAIMNGTLAGLVAITANCNVVDARSAVVIGAVGCCTMLATHHLLLRWRIDDVVGAIPVHLTPGIWGTLAVALFGNLDLIDTTLSRAEQLRIQLLGVTVAGVWAFGVSYLLLRALNHVQPLRISRRQEQIGLNVVEHGAASDLVNLFTTMRRQERTGNLSLRVPVELFTPVGQIAQRYNRVMAALEQATAKTEAIVQSATEAIITVSSQELIIRTGNPAVARIFGHSPQQVQGETLMKLITAKTGHHTKVNGAWMEAFLRQASQDGRPYEVVGKRRSGGHFPVEVTVAIVETRQEHFYTLILRDITLRRQAEEVLQVAEEKDLRSQQLEQALQELQQVQLKLIHSEKMSGLGQLVAGLAHEINNPVNFIYGNISHAQDYCQALISLIHAYQQEYPDISQPLREMLDEVDLPYLQTDLQKLLQSMQGGVERIVDIVRALQDFSRLGGTELKMVNVHDGISSTLTILSHRLRANSHRPAIEVIRQYGDVPEVQCYASQLNQVFMNLLSNAIDALNEKAEKGPLYGAWSPQIIISTNISANHRLRFQFDDNGMGIPPEVQQRILDPFFTTKPAGKGTGLGMSISDQIITQTHHGELKWLSRPGEGTSFILEIPLKQQAALVEAR